jgi:hypothetical protein
VAAGASGRLKSGPTLQALKPASRHNIAAHARRGYFDAIGCAMP